jgi:uncharacterized protein YjiS (DUF1127 family)
MTDIETLKKELVALCDAGLSDIGISPADKRKVAGVRAKIIIEL